MLLGRSVDEYNLDSFYSLLNAVKKKIYIYFVIVQWPLLLIRISVESPTNYFYLHLGPIPQDLSFSVELVVTFELCNCNRTATSQCGLKHVGKHTWM